MEKVENVISMLILFIITGVVSIIFYERHYTSKFSKTEVHVPFVTFKQHWGDPDKIIYHSQGTKRIVYNTILNEFAFNVSEKEIVEFKYKDNF